MISLAACAACFAAFAPLRSELAAGRGLSYTALGIAAALTAGALLVFHHNVRRSLTWIGSQLADMVGSGRVGPVTAEYGRELSEICGPLNDLLTRTRRQLDELRAAKRKLEVQLRVAEAEKQHAQAIIFSISDAVIVTNRFDELLLANEAAEKLLGFKLDDGQRKNIEGTISDGTLVRLIRETRSRGRKLSRKVVEHTIDHRGVPRTFIVTLNCVLTSTNEVSAVVAALHDVTREKEVSRMKTDFVSNVSHELKTPLASIRAYVEMLLDGEAEDEDTKREFHEIIFSETERLDRLIENILNISRIESGVVSVVKEPVSLAALAKQAADVVAPQARLKNVELVESLAPVRYQVQADRDMLYQAVLNLLSNAVKYTPRGGTVEISLNVDESRGMAVCNVADTGVGIPADELPHIFDKFYRVRANSKREKGTGLGLTLTKHIIETVHDGKLTVTSEPGKGSIFSFELPILS